MERNKPKREKTTYYFLFGHAPSNSFQGKTPAKEDVTHFLYVFSD